MSNLKKNKKNSVPVIVGSFLLHAYNNILSPLMNENYITFSPS